MAKRIVQDVIPPERRSIRNIPVPERRRKIETVTDGQPRAGKGGDGPSASSKMPKARASEARDLPALSENDQEYGPETEVWHDESDPYVPYEERRSSSPRYGVWIAVAVALVALAFAVSSLFSGALVKVSPRQASATVDGTFVASREGKEGTIPFDIIKVSREDGRSVAASGEKDVQTKSSGTVVIYNNYSSAPQGLVQNTRLATADGYVYRIQNPVTVPGAKIVNGEKVPGSIEVKVVADQAGEKYNIGQADFKVPGFEGTPRYDSFYARSKTPMSGGFSGKARVVSDETVAQAKDEIEFGLKQQLAKDVESQIPSGFTIFPQGLIYSFEDLPQMDEGGGTVKMSERGTLYAAIFNKQTLGAAIVSKYLPNSPGGTVEIANLPSLNFAIDPEAAFNPETDTAFNFNLSGAAQIVWQYDQTELKSDLAGSDKRNIDQILGKYPSIESAEVILRPFWNQKLPDDPVKIKLETVL